MLDFNYDISQSKTLKLIDLPVTPNLQEPNTVFMQLDNQGNYTLKVKA